MHKCRPARIKAAGAEDGLADGQFKALVSVFGNKDSYGDVIVPGAFNDSLAEWKSSGDPIPVYWSHQMSDPDMNIGWVVDASETADGLEVLAQLDLEDGASAKAKQVYRLLKGRRVTQFSFAYDVLDGGPVERDGDSFYELRRLKLHEVGPTPIGANQATDLLAVKQAADAARSLSDSTKSVEALREALAAIEATGLALKNVLGDGATDGAPEANASVANDVSESTTQSTEEPASEPGPAKDEEPTRAKSEEPGHRHPSVATWATAIQLAELEGSL